jgi:hypothetical protein
MKATIKVRALWPAFAHPVRAAMLSKGVILYTLESEGCPPHWRFPIIRKQFSTPSLPGLTGDPYLLSKEIALRGWLRMIQIDGIHTLILNQEDAQGEEQGVAC